MGRKVAQALWGIAMQFHFSVNDLPLSIKNGIFPHKPSLAHPIVNFFGGAVR